MRKNWMRKVLKFLVIAAVAITVFSLLVMVLWNWLMPTLFGWPVITFWQALGLLILIKILFGRFPGRPGAPQWHWRRRMMERWDRMTPEEREKFRHGLRGGLGPFGSSAEPEK